MTSPVLGRGWVVRGSRRVRLRAREPVARVRRCARRAGAGGGRYSARAWRTSEIGLATSDGGRAVAVAPRTPGAEAEPLGEVERPGQVVDRPAGTPTGGQHARTMSAAVRAASSAVSDVARVRRRWRPGGLVAKRGSPAAPARPGRAQGGELPVVADGDRPAAGRRSGTPRTARWTDAGCPGCPGRRRRRCRPTPG